MSMDRQSLLEEQVRQRLKRLSLGKSSGRDDTNNAASKTCALELAPSLFSLFRHSLKIATTPKAWKRPVVIPIYEGGSRTEVSNYRSTILLYTISKVMEILLDI
ncbi:hypothetical protein PHET_11421 [Paragonimus heterotremus]|uniref:Uncharacterized protein n=1 Tax=Paragonimus heterotremus TaxID=100268 RepID=A0A8J4WDK8_9TREM|nr:hypothetical protein PHET_11421 [Paragonimus heterotremus]